MTRSEAIDMLRQIGTYLTAGNPMWRTEPIRDACDMAIEALTEREASANDLISRQEALDALNGEITVTGRANAEAVLEYANLITDRIKRLPFAQPERRGKWIKHDNSCECPFCHTEWSYFDNEVEWFKYCPDCGAKMEKLTDMSEEGDWKWMT